MLQRLSPDRRAEIKADYADRKWCFMPVTTTGGWIGLAIAVAGEDGYRELPLDEVYADSYAEMNRFADELNAEIGCSPIMGAQIVAATPHANGES